MLATVCADSQNAHNKGVEISAKRALENLRKSATVFRKTKEETINEIQTLIDVISPTIKSYILPVLNKLYHDIPNGVEISELVWSRINHPDNSDRVEDLKKIFIFQMAECNPEGSGVLCNDGVIHRLIGTLDHSDKIIETCQLIPSLT